MKTKLQPIKPWTELDQAKEDLKFVLLCAAAGEYRPFLNSAEEHSLQGLIKSLCTLRTLKTQELWATLSQLRYPGPFMDPTPPEEITVQPVFRCFENPKTSTHPYAYERQVSDFKRVFPPENLYDILMNFWYFLTIGSIPAFLRIAQLSNRDLSKLITKMILRHPLFLQDLYMLLYAWLEVHGHTSRTWTDLCRSSTPIPYRFFSFERILNLHGITVKTYSTVQIVRINWHLGAIYL